MPSQLQRVVPSRDPGGCGSLLEAGISPYTSRLAHNSIRRWARYCNRSTACLVSEHQAEYPPADAPELTADDVRDDIPNARAVVDLCERVLDQMSPF